MKSLERWGWVIAVLLAIAFTITPLIARTAAGDPLVVGGESYYNLRISEEVRGDLFLQEDPLQERPYNFNLYHYFLAFLGYIFTDQALILSSLVLSLLAVFFLHRSLLNLGMKRESAILTIIIYLFTPLYAYLATTLTPATLTLFLLTSSLYLYSRNQDVTSLLPATLTVLTTPEAFIIFKFAMMTYHYYNEESMAPTMQAFLTGLGITGLAALLFNYIPGIQFIGGFALSEYLTDFGAILGYPFFALVLAFLAIVVYWKDFKSKIIHLLFLLLLTVSTALPDARLIMNIGVSIYAAYAVKFFLERDWTVINLRDLTLLLLFSSLLFSGVSYGNRLTKMEPQENTVAVLGAIADENREGGVLTAPENGFLAEYYAEKKVLLDSYSKYYTNYEEKKEAMEQMLTSSDPENTKEMFNENNITYVYADEGMKEEYWVRRGGLLLVLDVSENFIKLSELQGKESWLYIRT